ncbi:MAG: hypothetical protein GC161_15505 [Planctomycetaceae bacterium]|nr:hypothetical protein [Planctomycetaceae bacterium]
MRLPSFALASCMLGLLLSSPAKAHAASGQVWVVESGTALDQIHKAVALAADGDVILVRPGSASYEAFSVQGKSLTIEGDPGAKVWNLVFFAGYLGPAVQVADLGPDQHLVLRNLEIQNTYNEPVAALDIRNCAGSIQIEDCTVVASQGPASGVIQSQAVTMVRTTLQTQGPFQPAGSTGYQVQPGLRVAGSNVHLFDCTVVGSGGKESSFLSQGISAGGPGVLVNSGLLYASGTSVSGGKGGGQSTTVPGGACTPFGQGGPGLVVDGPTATTRVVWLDSSAVGGEGGEPLVGCTQPQAPPGPDQLVISGSFDPVAGTRRAFGVVSPLRQGEQALMGFAGEPGDTRWLLLSPGPNKGVYLEGLDIVAQLDPAQLATVFLGTLPAEGAEVLSFPVPTLPPGVAFRTWTAQCLNLAPNSNLFLSGPSEFVVLGAGL